MNIRMAAQTIRDTVSIDQVLSLYGYAPKRGFMVCPFHGDRDASLKVYPGTGGWHCFGCGKGGSVIDFVMEQEGCDFRTAVTAIDHALNLGLRDPRENPYAAEETENIQHAADDYAEAASAYLDACERATEDRIRTDMERMRKCRTLRMMDPPILTAADYNFMEQYEELIRYGEYTLERISEMREEVAAWRRAARRAKSA